MATKKYVTFLLAVALLFTLVGCGGKGIEMADSINSGLSANECLEFRYTKFELADVFADGMTIDADKDFTVWGLAERGKKVELKLCDLNDAVVESICVIAADNNSFKVRFRAVAPSFSEYKLCAKCGDDEITVGNILFGKVYFAGGQSNMEFKVSKMADMIEYVSENLNGNLRFYYTDTLPLYGATASDYPYSPQFFGSRGRWVSGDDFTGLLNVSAVAYTFAVELSGKLNGEVPIGVVDTSVGATGIENWLSRKTVESDEDFLALSESYGKYVGYSQWNEKGAQNYNQMSANFNLKIAPLRFLNFSGAIWYQGENNISDKDFEYFRQANAKFAGQFADIFGFDGNTPFVSVLVAPYGYYAHDDGILPALWEAQADFQSVSCVDAMTVAIYDIAVTSYDNADPSQEIHPSDKIPVGRRLAEAVCSMSADGEKSPRIAGGKYGNGKVILSFEYLSAIRPIDEENGFSGIELIYGDETVRVPLTDLCADGNVVSFSAEMPDAVVYNYGQLRSDGNIKNASGFPLLPFRLDLIQEK
ncbi:MAG: sialate O-acetylesterase [Christensenellales bacterium]